MIEDPLLQDVFGAVENYCRQRFRFGFDPEAPVVRLHEPTFAAPEIQQAVAVLLSTRVTMGDQVKAFETAFSHSGGFAHGVMNNSGSSANLLMVAALANPATEGYLRPGDEVIVPALSWSTTVWPLVQHQLVPVIADIDPVTLNLDPDALEAAIGPRTRAVMPVHVYGNPCDMNALTAICRRRGLLLMEDCCEALGASFEGTPVGRFGRAGSFSFYYSHHITTLEGGITVTDDFQLAERMRILRAHGWIREVEDPAPFLDPDIDSRFLFVDQGYNLRPTELQAAIGLVQLPKLPGFVATRRANARLWMADLEPWSAFLDWQRETPGGESSWFGINLVVREEAPFSVRDIREHLRAAHIETRPIICGNIARQPGMRRFPHRVAGTLAHANRVMDRGFSFANHQFIDETARRYIRAQLAVFLARHGLG